MNYLELLNSQLISQLEQREGNDFLSPTASTEYYPPFQGAAVNGGTSYSSAGTPRHPGQNSLRSGATANSGFRYMTHPAAFLLGGGERGPIFFKTGSSLATTLIRVGYHNATDQNAPTNGVYCKIDGGVLTGQCANNSTISTSASNYTVAPDTWYRLAIELNADATTAKFTLYADDSNAVLWTDTLSTNIPKTAGHEVGHGIVATSSGTTAITICYIDRMDINFSNARRVS